MESGGSSAGPRPVIEFADFRLDPLRRKLSTLDGTPLALNSRAFDTLLVLVERRGEVVSKHQLMDAVWPKAVVEENNLNKAISALRKTLGDSDTNRIILTVPGRGFCFVAEVRNVTDRSAGKGLDSLAPESSNSLVIPAPLTEKSESASPELPDMETPQDSQFIPDCEPEREATLLAALNHPNIAAIHGIEDPLDARFLVLELVEGSTLADRLRAGPLPIDESLRLAVQIAEQLEAAHDKGVVHRDLKPANIKVTLEGRVKVLDFGLSKALTPAWRDVPTATTIHTELGAIMGTAPYMSPEQARGADSDEQTDIWSFGVVLYEMLTGTSPFKGDTSTETLARVLNTPPDYSLLPLDTTARVRHLLSRCLEKDQRRRSQHIGDVRIELEDALTESTAEPGASSAASTSVRPRRGVGVLALAAAVAIALVGLGAWFVNGRSVSEASAGVVRLSIPSLEAPSSWPSGVRHVAISRDGSRAAYAGQNLLIRRLSDEAAVTVAVEGSNPFFSPDGDKLGFYSKTGGVFAVPSAGGTPVMIVANRERPAGAAWGPDGTIIFANTEGLYRVAENGGQPELLKRPDPLRKERLYAWPEITPDGQSVLFTVLSEGTSEAPQIASLNLKTLESKIVLTGGSVPRYASTGHLLYASGQTLNAIEFDSVTLETRGDPVAISDALVASTLDNGAAEFAVSDTGTLVFLAPLDPTAQSLQTLSWVDRQGVEEPLPLEPGQYLYPSISPDGTRVALDMYSAGNRDIWTWDLERQSLTRLTSHLSEDLMPLWSPDSRRVYFASNRAGTIDIYSQSADGATEARVEFAGERVQFPNSITPDGAQLVVYENFRDLSVLNLSEPGHMEPLLFGEFDERLAALSPDGHWIVYESDESDGQVEIFLRPFPDVGARREKISIAGGRYPRWGAQGSEIFYVGLDGGMMAVSVQLSPNFVLGRVTKLFDLDRPRAGRSGIPYDISPVDGRFLVIKRDTTSRGAATNISVVLNWFSELREQAPPR